MEINADFTQIATADTKAMDWVPSPLAGVERKMLDRIGDEVARATSIVRYAPGNFFSPHSHAMGEEFLVLEGVFEDEHGKYPAGTYVRNPWGTAHTPSSAEGCTLFVKLRQFEEADQNRFSIDTKSAEFGPHRVEGLSVLPLHEFGDEYVRLVKFDPETQVPLHAHAGGEEILVLEGDLHDETGNYSPGCWVRFPDGRQHTPNAGPDGALIWVKSGHLPGVRG